MRYEASAVSEFIDSLDANLFGGEPPVVTDLGVDFDPQSDEGGAVFHSVRFQDRRLRTIEIIAPINRIVRSELVDAAVGEMCIPRPALKEIGVYLPESVGRSGFFGKAPDVIIVDSSLRRLFSGESDADSYFHAFGRNAIKMSHACRLAIVRNTTIRFAPVSAALDAPLSEPSRQSGAADTRSRAQQAHDRVMARVEDVMELPPLPGSAMKLLELRFDADFHASKLIDVIKTDPQLSAQIVSWASSPAYSASPVLSIEQAVSRTLGAARTLNMATAVAIKGSMTVPTSYQPFAAEAWTALVSTAVLSQSIAKRLGGPFDPDVSYLVGLLHLIGVLTCMALIPNKVESYFLAQTINPSMDTEILEESLLGFSSGDLTAALLDSWGSPAALIGGILSYRNPLSATDHDGAAITTHLAIQRLIDLGRYPHFIRSHADQIMRAYRIDPQTIDDAEDELMSQMDFINSFAQTVMRK